jgi:hypothetical protein
MFALCDRTHNLLREKWVIGSLCQIGRHKFIGLALVRFGVQSRKLSNIGQSLDG